jgi:hypothetical protein
MVYIYGDAFIDVVFEQNLDVEMDAGQYAATVKAAFD